MYFLHNEVETIENIAKKVEALLPEGRVRIAHGQMRERELEHVMLDFYHQRFNCLVCTTIIETGIDIPNANTIMIDRAESFGLADLYQLRGRVGRSGGEQRMDVLDALFDRLTGRGNDAGRITSAAERRLRGEEVCDQNFPLVSSTPARLHGAPAARAPWRHGTARRGAGLGPSVLDFRRESRRSFSCRPVRSLDLLKRTGREDLKNRLSRIDVVDPVELALSRRWKARSRMNDRIGRHYDAFFRQFTAERYRRYVSGLEETLGPHIYRFATTPLFLSEERFARLVDITNSGRGCSPRRAIRRWSLARRGSWRRYPLQPSDYFGCVDYHLAGDSGEAHRGELLSAGACRPD